MPGRLTHRPCCPDRASTAIAHDRGYPGGPDAGARQRPKFLRSRWFKSANSHDGAAKLAKLLSPFRCAADHGYFSSLSRNFEYTVRPF